MRWPCWAMSSATRVDAARLDQHAESATQLIGMREGLELARLLCTDVFTFAILGYFALSAPFTGGKCL